MRPRQVSAPTPKILFQTGVPFIMLGGDGAAAGMKWTDALGNFSVTAEPLSTLFSSVLVNVMSLFYLKVNCATGVTNTAGWYWGKILSATAGIIYSGSAVSNQPGYTTGDPGTQIPTSFSTFTSATNAWVTQTNAEITGLNGITLPGGALGANGQLEWWVRMLGDISSDKTYASKLGGTTWASQNSTTSPVDERLFRLSNDGVVNKQIPSRINSGVGNSSASINNVAGLTLDTSGNLALVETLKFAVATGNYAMVRANSRYVVCPRS